MQTASNDTVGRRRGGSARTLVLAGVLGLAVPALAAGLARCALAAARACLVPGPARPADPLTATVAALALLLLGWLWAGAVATALATRPGRLGARAAALSARIAPRLLRGLVCGALGAGLALAPPATASPAPAGYATALLAGERAPDPTLAPDPAPAPDWVPRAPARRPQPDPALLVRRPGSDDEPAEVVVRRGDTLWEIAARHLGAGSSTAEVARAWPRWYAANRAVIGADPDLIRPGQRLRVPEPVP